MVPIASSPCGFKGKLKFLIILGFIVFLSFYFVILAVFVINDRKFDSKPVI